MNVTDENPYSCEICFLPAGGGVGWRRQYTTDKLSNVLGYAFWKKAKGEQGKRNLEWPKQGEGVSENTVFKKVWPLFCSKASLTHPFKN